MVLALHSDSRTQKKKGKGTQEIRLLASCMLQSIFGLPAFLGKGGGVCSAPCPGRDPAPCCSSTPRQISKQGIGSCTREDFLMAVAGLRDMFLVTQTRCLCPQKWNPLLATAGLNCCWNQTSATVNQLLSIPLNNILPTCGVLIISCLFQTYASAILVALGAKKRPWEWPLALQWLLSSQDKSQSWHHLQLCCTDTTTMT